MSKDSSPHCFHCTHYFALTNTEIAELRRLYGTYAHFIDGVKGVCLDTTVFPKQIIQRFIFNPNSYCPAHDYGYSMENLHMKCPSCHDGEICVSRPFINDSRVLIIGCSRYPECRYSTKQLVLNVTCRFCRSRLVLTGGDILRCTCQGCGKSVSLPVAFKTYPGLALPNGGCVHTEHDLNCEMCRTSRSERKSLLVLEMESMFNSPRLYADLLVNPPVNNPKAPISNPKKSKPPYRPRFGKYSDDDLRDDGFRLSEDDLEGNSFI